MPAPIRPRSALTIVACCFYSLAAALPVRGQEMGHEMRIVASRWWEEYVAAPILEDPEWVSFDLNAVVLDALAHNPRIAAVTHQAAIAMERIVQEDAVFDPAVLLSSNYGSTSDPVGNTLTTGGPPRLQQDSWDNQAGVVKTARDGTRIDLSQSMGLLDSNSLFFVPNNQGNTRLNLSVTKPLRAGAGRAYNERLIIQARIDSKVTMQDIREQVQDRLALTMLVYWKIYQTRCQLIQQRALLQRGLEIETIIQERQGFDSGELEIAKVVSRIAKRRDQVVEQERDLKNLQTQLAALVGSESLRPGLPLEMIPLGTPACLSLDIDVRDAVVSAMSHRPDVRSAALDLESASLEISISRNELLPQLNAVVGGYLAGLNPNNDVLASFGDQFSSGRPGFNGGLEYEMPYARRAAKSRVRAAHQRFLEMSEQYREAVATTQAEVETAVRNLQVAFTRLDIKRQIFDAAVKQESLVRLRWESMGPDGRHAALVLEDLLDQQENRTNAERDLVASEVEYISSLIELQKSMGTLLIAEGIQPLQKRGEALQWTRTEPEASPIQPNDLPIQPNITPSAPSAGMIETE